MNRRTISIALAVVCLAVLLGAAGQFAINRETSYMQECVSEALPLMVTIGMTKRVGKPWLFLRRTTGRWRLVDQDGICTDGQFKRTDDPNILILKKENGEEFGAVHVAYISRRRDQGLLYLFRDTRVTRFYLVSTGPAFTVESGDVDADR